MCDDILHWWSKAVRTRKLEVIEAGDAGEPVILKESKIKERMEIIVRKIEKWLK